MEKLFGRQELVRKSSQILKHKQLCHFPAMEITQQLVRCRRCNSSFKKESVQLENGSYYCPDCILLGRVSSDLVLLYQPEPPRKSRQLKFAWQGTLTPQQKYGSKKIVQALKEKRSLLLWAVTGAGKTEMLFEGVAYALKKGQRVAIASPRIDVCRELFPRLTAVFPDTDCLLLYGDSEEKYRYTPLIICTTHQLLRFYHAFDVLIVDEIDAFPFADDPRLHFAVEQSRLPHSSLIYLTATPSQKLLKEIAGTFSIVKLPARYHRRALPVPQLFWWNQWQQKILQGKNLNKLVQLLKKLLLKNRVLLFCPSIILMEHLTLQLEPLFPEISLNSVHSNHPKREKIVEEMRQGSYQLLLTTTILERGVTFENISVIILGANHRVFNRAALVQIAGRVDRKGAYTAGEVIYIYDEMTKAIKSAIKEIKGMNQTGKEAGLLDEM